MGKSKSWGVGIPALDFHGYPLIKMSDFETYRAQFDLDERDVLVVPDDLWKKLVDESSQRKPD